MLGSYLDSVDVDESTNTFESCVQVQGLQYTTVTKRKPISGGQGDVATSSDSPQSKAIHTISKIKTAWKRNSEEVGSSTPPTTERMRTIWLCVHTVQDDKGKAEHIS